MKSKQSMFLIIVVLLLFTLTSSAFIVKSWTEQGKLSQENKVKGASMKSEKPLCGNIDAKASNLTEEQAAAYTKSENLFNYGYPSDIPLSQAVNEFNACYTTTSESPLTEGEVIAALYDADLKRPSNNPEAVAADLEKIIYKKLMPKGARFSVERSTPRSSLSKEDRDAFNRSEIYIRRWIVYLVRGLDKTPIYTAAPSSDQLFLIRQRYYGIE